VRRYRILGIHVYAPYGQLDRGAQKKPNEHAAEGWEVVAATGWALILEQRASGEVTAGPSTPAWP
jgi:hypothetical protein